MQHAKGMRDFEVTVPTVDVWIGLDLDWFGLGLGFGLCTLFADGWWIWALSGGWTLSWTLVGYWFGLHLMDTSRIFFSQVSPQHQWI
jgi:hypothetical protein